MAPGTRVGTVIENKYRLDEQIGHGGMGAVYRGVQLAVDRPVAIKLLHPNFAGHDKLQARFEVEAKAIARLNHPNCITLFDFGYSEDMAAFYTVVEFIDGTPLEALISRRPSVARVVNLIRQIASALGHAHHHGILHRDLKPENIMIAEMTDGSEMVKVLDFGIAQIMKGNTDEDGDDDDFEADRLTRVGEVFGTPPYMSPEQAQSSRDLTPTADLYSLGIIFYELLEGRLPFLAETPLEILAMHLKDPPPPLNRHDISDSVKAVVMQMLSKDPEDRPASGGKVIELLDAIPGDELPTESPAIGAPGKTRSSDPTLISAPPSPDNANQGGVVSSSGRPTMITEPDEELGPGEASVILELTDIVPDEDIALETPEVARQHRASASVDATSTIPVANVSETSPGFQVPQPASDDDDFLAGMRRANLTRNFIVILGLLLMAGFGVGVWWINDSASLASHDQSNSHPLNSQEPAAMDFSDLPETEVDSPSERPPREISVAEHDRQLEEAKDDDGEQAEDVESTRQEPSQPATQQRRQPRPQPPPLHQDDSSSDDPATGEQERRPQPLPF